MAGVGLRSEEPVLPRLWQRSNLVRLGAVLITVLAATCLGCFCWQAPVFRVGQTYRYEVRARVYFEVVDRR